MILVIFYPYILSPLSFPITHVSKRIQEKSKRKNRRNILYSIIYGYFLISITFIHVFVTLSRNVKPSPLNNYNTILLIVVDNYTYKYIYNAKF